MYQYGMGRAIRLLFTLGPLLAFWWSFFPPRIVKRAESGGSEKSINTFAKMLLSWQHYRQSDANKFLFAYKVAHGQQYKCTSFKIKGWHILCLILKCHQLFECLKGLWTDWMWPAGCTFPRSKLEGCIYLDFWWTLLTRNAVFIFVPCIAKPGWSSGGNEQFVQMSHFRIASLWVCWQRAGLITHTPLWGLVGERPLMSAIWVLHSQHMGVNSLPMTMVWLQYRQPLLKWDSNGNVFLLLDSASF